MSNAKQEFVTVRKNPKLSEEQGKTVIFTPGNKPGWGTIAVETAPQIRSVNGILTRVKRSALTVMEESTFNELGLKEGIKLPGKVVYITSDFPQWEGHEPKINPQTQETVVNEFGNPVYLKRLYTTDMNATDEFISEEAEVEAEEEVNAQDIA